MCNDRVNTENDIHAFNPNSVQFVSLNLKLLSHFSEIRYSYTNQYNTNATANSYTNVFS